MRIAVLGPLEVLTQDSVPVDVPDATERLLLGVLVAGAPDAVATGVLIETLWGQDPPESADEAIRARVAGLRRSFEPGLPERSSGQYVLRRASGYALALPRGDIDTLRFADLVARGRARLAAGDAADAARLLTTALGLWRGEPFFDWPAAAFSEEERRRLAEIRADAEVARRQARTQQQAGRHPEARRESARPVRERRGAVDVPAVPVTVPAQEPAPATPPLPPEGPHSEPPHAEVDAADPDDGRRRARRANAGHRTGLLVGGVAAALVAALGVARLSAISEQQAERAAAVADANRLAALSATATPLDVSLLLAAQAYRLADTPETRGGLTTALDGHARVERAVSFGGVPQDALLSGGNTVTFGVGNSLWGWAIGPSTVPGVLIDLPGTWGASTVVAPSPVEDLLLLAGVHLSGAPWLRTVSTLDGTSRLLLDADQVGGRPVDGAVTADGRRLLLVVAEPAGAARDATSWHLIDVDVSDGAKRDTGIGGVAPVPFEWLRADFADDSASVVVWDGTVEGAATLVQVADGRQTTIAAYPRPAESFGFRALPSGVAQLWADGAVTLIDAAGTTVQELDVAQAPVRDIAVSPDGRWAVTAGYGGDVFRWDVDPATGRWSARERLAGHTGDVVGVEAAPGGERAVTVSADHTIISWDMSPDGDRAGGLPTDAAARLDAACAIVGRDFTAAEWRAFFQDRPWQSTCTDPP